ncbi:MAG: hypothetical protein OHK0017_10480 [Patescibacteria group bacterium]
MSEELKLQNLAEASIATQKNEPVSLTGKLVSLAQIASNANSSDYIEALNLDAWDKKFLEQMQALAVVLDAEFSQRLNHKVQLTSELQAETEKVIQDIVSLSPGGNVFASEAPFRQFFRLLENKIIFSKNQDVDQYLFVVKLVILRLSLPFEQFQEALTVLQNLETEFDSKNQEIHNFVIAYRLEKYTYQNAPRKSEFNPGYKETGDLIPAVSQVRQELEMLDNFPELLRVLIEKQKNSFPFARLWVREVITSSKVIENRTERLQQENLVYKLADIFYINTYNGEPKRGGAPTWMNKEQDLRSQYNKLPSIAQKIFLGKY